MKTALESELKAISKIVDHVQSKASIRFESGAYTEYVSILNRIATQLLGVRCCF